MRSSLLVTSALALAAGAAAVAVPATANAALVPPVLLTPLMAPMLPGQSGWVSAMWSAPTAICDVKVTAAGSGVTVAYPTNTGTYSSFSKQDALAANLIDYTAFRVTVDSTRTTIGAVNFTMSYTERSGVATSGDCVGTAKTVTETAALPVIATSGSSVVQKTSSVTVTRSTPVWVQVSYQGRKPGLANFRAALTAPSGLSVTYPGDGTSAGLNLAPTLAVGTDDYVSVRLDASGLSAGTYKVPVHATYTGGTFDDDLTVVVQ